MTSTAPYTEDCRGQAIAVALSSEWYRPLPTRLGMCLHIVDEWCQVITRLPSNGLAFSQWGCTVSLSSCFFALVLILSLVLVWVPIYPTAERESLMHDLVCINILVDTWSTTQRCLSGSFDTIWQLQNIIMSDSESLWMVNVNFILPAKYVSCGQPLAVSLLASSVLPWCRCILCFVNHCLLSETDSYSSILPYSMQWQMTKVRSHSARVSCIQVIYVRGHTNCIPMRYRTNIVALAQIRPPHCMISCLASCSAIMILTCVCVWWKWDVCGAGLDY